MLKHKSMESVFYAFVAGKNIKLTDFTAKDVFVAGETITFKNASVRTLFASGSTIEFTGNISKRAYLAGENVVISGNVDGDVVVASANLTVEDNTVINGTLKYPEDATAKVSESASVANVKTYKTDTPTEKSTAEKVCDAIISWITSFAAILIVALVFMALNSKFFTKVTKLGKTAKESIILMLIGLGVLIITPIVGIIAMIGIVTIPLCVIALLFYGIMIYVSVIPTSYYLGNLLLKDKIKNKYLLLSVSLFALCLIKAIPIVGGLIGFLSLVFGLGVFFKAIKEMESSK